RFAPSRCTDNFDFRGEVAGTRASAGHISEPCAGCVDSPVMALSVPNLARQYEKKTFTWRRIRKVTSRFSSRFSPTQSKIPIKTAASRTPSRIGELQLHLLGSATLKSILKLEQSEQYICATIGTLARRPQ